MAGSAGQEWLDRNAHRAFPFEEDSDFSCENGSVLPTGLVLDARACLFGPSGKRDVFMDFAAVSDGTVGIGLTCGGVPMDVLWSRGGTAFATSGDVSVRVTFCDGAALSAMAGEYRLRKPARLLPCRVLSVPCGIGVDELRCGGMSAAGTVRVASGHNTELGVRGDSLVLEVREGIGKGRSCPGDMKPAGALYCLNGQKVDSDGSIWIAGSDGVVVTTGEYKGIPAVFVSTSAVVNNFMYR